MKFLLNMQTKCAAAIVLLALSFVSSSVLAHSELEPAAAATEIAVAGHLLSADNSPEPNPQHQEFKCHHAATCGGSAMMSQATVVISVQLSALHPSTQTRQLHSFSASPPTPPPD